MSYFNGSRQFTATRYQEKNIRALDQRNGLASENQQPRKYGNGQTSLDFLKIETFMETMSKTLESLVVRMNSMEKGTPSWPVVGELNQVQPTIPKPPAVRHVAAPAPARFITTYQPDPPSTSTAGPKMQPAKPTEPVIQSENSDFAQICKGLNRMVQLKRHKTNWATLPASIERNIQHVAKNIRPVQPTDKLTTDISAIFERAGTELRDRVMHHFDECIDSNVASLKRFNPLDKDRAIDIVTNQLQTRLGKKVTQSALRKMVEEEAKVIGVANSHSFKLPKNAVKKPCVMKTPPFNTHNSFGILETLGEGNDDVEQETPSPVRKIPNRHLPQTPRNVDNSVGTVTFTPSKLSTPGTSNRQAVTQMETIPMDLESSTHATAALVTDIPPIPSTPNTSQTHVDSKFTRHSPSDKSSWKVELRADTECLIIADSNLKYLTNDDIPSGFQVDSFSGANFTNIVGVIKDLPNDKINHLFLAIGINHKDDNFETRTWPAMEGVLQMARDKAKTGVTTVEVSINQRFAQNRKDNLKQVNRQLRRCANNYVPPLYEHEIFVDQDGVHYTRDTQLRILKNIIANASPKN